ncbi:MAG: ribosome-associated translation inhibitor RaiA [Micavibrio aeruginosavorus]|uniref:Ribosome hibernation promoting factor n=1 Tax=Micavibrio aeruginosavorus TaxID=349221 RepID=A0A7T5R288_9BACT|nr:MAG: ribosome-associated translation inhibitor RaiA [Micavibrio aeruginosavorus]
MHITVQGKQMNVGDALRTHVTNKLEDMNSKYFNHGTDANITFSKEGHGHGLIRAHISVRVGSSIMVMADAEEGDAYLAFDTAAEKAAKQLRRYKRRLRDHHDRLQRTPESDMLKARDYTLSSNDSDEEGDLPKGDEALVIAEMTTHIPTLTVSEAVMRLDLAHQNAFLFRSAKHGGINMVYRRADGNIGWVDPGLAASLPKASSKATTKAPAKKVATKKSAAKSNVKKLPAKKKAAAKKTTAKTARKRA